MKPACITAITSALSCKQWFQLFDMLEHDLERCIRLAQTSAVGEAQDAFAAGLSDRAEVGCDQTELLGTELCIAKLFEIVEPQEKRQSLLDGAVSGLPKIPVRPRNGR